MKRLDILLINRAIDNMKYHAELIVRDADQLTTGNLAHHKASMRMYAQSIINIAEDQKAKIDILKDELEL